MFEPNWFIAGSVAVFRTNGFEDTVMLVTYAEAGGGVCELVVMAVASSIRNKRNRVTTRAFLLSMYLKLCILAKKSHRRFVKQSMWF